MVFFNFIVSVTSFFFFLSNSEDSFLFKIASIYGLLLLSFTCMMCLTAQNNGSLADFVFAYVDIIGNVAIARIAESFYFIFFCFLAVSFVNIISCLRERALVFSC